MSSSGVHIKRSVEGCKCSRADLQYTAMFLCGELSAGVIEYFADLGHAY